jgi:methionine-rich copper-binding protein CopC
LGASDTAAALAKLPEGVYSISWKIVSDTDSQAVTVRREFTVVHNSTAQ